MRRRCGAACRSCTSSTASARRHEVDKIDLLDDDDLRALVRDDDVLAFRLRGLTPDAPVVRGTAQNPDVFFQAREAANPFHAPSPASCRR